MVDPGTGLTLLGTAIGSAKLIEKVLGPTAEYLGNGICEFTKKRVENVARIFEIAGDTLGDAVDEPGAVHPKVLRQVIDEGSFCDDEVAAQYFGGVLASSRTEDGDDDRGSTLLKQVSRLTSHQLRAHYIFYSLIREVHIGKNTRLQARNDCPHLGIRVPLRAFSDTMRFGYDAFSLLIHVMSGLARETLLGNPNEFWDKFSAGLLKENLIAVPTLSGIELFLWAHGQGTTKVTKWLREGVHLAPLWPFKLDGEARPLDFDAI